MLPPVWRRLQRAVRVLLGFSCLAVELAASGWTLTRPAGLFAVYTLYGIVTLTWRNLEESGHQTIGLMIDSVFLFLALAASEAHMDSVGVLFYVYVVGSAIVQHDWWAPVVVAALSIVVLNFAQPASYEMLLPTLTAAGVLGSLVALERQLLKDRLANASRQSVLYRYDAERARESERQRIAADFHDGPLQSFISFQMRLEIIRKLMGRDRDASEQELVQLQELCKSQVQELRSFVRSMRPVDVDGSLNSSVRRVIEQFQKDSGITATFASTEFVDPTEPEVSLELLQIVREALYNVQKHSGATRVAVGIQKHERALEISVEDNGRGFPFSGRYNLEELELLRLGPGSIKRRVRTLGGELLLESKPGQGAGLTVNLAT